MGRIEIATQIAAPREICFDLARSVELHVDSLAHTGERAVGGVTRGLLALGDEITWSARHLGVRQTLTGRITAFERPGHFRDSMVRGIFARIDHDHFFERTGSGGTRMVDLFDFRAPLGLVGRLVERAFLDRYMRRILLARAEVIRRTAESGDWRRYLAATAAPA